MVANVSEERIVSIFKHREAGDDTFLRNVGNNLQVHTTSQPNHRENLKTKII
jgi:hypothetical protein